MRILRSAEYRRMPWKNGGGETREIAVWPIGAGLDALDWRISLATVATDGPFSSFPGVTRTLCVIHGAGIELKVGSEPTHVLRMDSEPYTFDGEMTASASLIDGPIVDMNVMSRRGRYGHRVSRNWFSGSREIRTTADSTAIFCREGAVVCSVLSHRDELRAEDCALVEGAPQSIQLHAPQRAEILLIELYRE